MKNLELITNSFLYKDKTSQEFLDIEAITEVECNTKKLLSLYNTFA
ncbi:hypothetical protein [Staphylococcus argenteus]|nr:hypothetical protein [Staphylococcus argenteus]MCG6477606.1 hypothetical protein [Staphylococcus argenteus]MDH9757376.1 hypothetical protein [Staphylococcus argenteus]MDH9764354.1 hypothetical protein [Staphylococcus argenteus]MDH9865542.1 hypothetical protein [Staphylococcus argenteus]HDY9572392.1 hypothetical protein [Staphylococcus argenteus]